MHDVKGFASFEL